ncbi:MULTISPECIES: orotidine-5'-phosphate decarboxylase [unclassified Prochlorococcus]|uniref:orotidine-5'-phosphate decarboxylase n=1 Tax=unclassified Prochlorococcus TaxID=2627481 RepID=UPI000533B2CB|nr:MULTISPECIES: orotidine-5'-phosphate decarboxylase [unclassified Prochlorococcus]KGG16231.1 Orotidine 5'-phosphate decarboxylase [Prochlorococcus sp. MIT 0603]KGG18035.1 Orotidine 5'-phosphate decarboxylase [Prochlorococcus sp. MIT 0602]
MIASFKPEEKLILALDRLSEEDMLLLIEKLPNLIWVKVGLELFTLLGPEVIGKLRGLGKKVFLDLKFHDIPTTMARACYQAAKSGAELITVHACAGKKGLEAANQSAQEGAMELGLEAPCLLAVTVLTSWKSQDFINELAIHQPLADRTLFLAELASEAGIGGCICSPMEVNKLRRIFPEPFQLITPGIRSIGVDLNDQARVMTPLEALKAGSSKLVIGREITNSENPLESFNRICDQLLNN